MKNLHKLMIFIVAVFIVIFLLVSVAPVFGADGTADLVEEGQSWLAKQLETYGVPTAISSIIVSFGTGGTIWLFLRGFKKSKGQMIAALEKVGLSAESLNNVLGKLDYVEKRLEDLETESKKNMETTYQEKVIPILNDVKNTLSEIQTMKEEIKDGTLKIVKSLTEEV